MKLERSDFEVRFVFPLKPSCCSNSMVYQIAKEEVDGEDELEKETKKSEVRQSSNFVSVGRKHLQCQGLFKFTSGETFFFVLNFFVWIVFWNKKVLESNRF